MTDIIHVPLNRLALWDGNVRKTDINVGIDELAASIAAHGLLQSLVVRKGKRGKYEIVAGQRRFLALQSLAKDGALATDCQIPCALANDQLDSAEISLAENAIRAPMHPADQFEAFRTIIDSGATVADVAARFGLAETVVTKRLKLGRLSPVILEAYRAGDIDLDGAQAFAINDDHAAQERVLAELPEWNREADAIRSALTTDEVPTSDKRVRFIGIDAYRDVGGIVRQDLFSQDGEGYLQDSGLLDRLVREKLYGASVQMSAEGWSWVDIIPDADYSLLAGFKRLYPERAELSETDQAEFDRLSQEYDELADSDHAEEDCLAALEQRIEALGGSEIWPAGTLSAAGAIVSLDYRGELRIERGLVRKQDAHKLPAESDATDPEALPVPHAKGLSPRLTEDLTAQKTAAIGAELMGRPDLALAAVVHRLALDLFYAGCSSESCLKLSARSAYASSAMSSPEDCNALVAIDRERERFGDRLPGDPADLWTWMLARSRDELLDMLAFIAATSVDAMQRKNERADTARLAHADLLADALQLDMTRWFTPTAESYFGRVNRTQILAAIDEAIGSHAPALEKLKKAELASRAETLVAASSWLPAPLRITVNDNRGCDQSEAAE